MRVKSPALQHLPLPCLNCLGLTDGACWGATWASSCPAVLSAGRCVDFPAVACQGKIFLQGQVHIMLVLCLCPVLPLLPRRADALVSTAEYFGSCHWWVQVSAFHLLATGDHLEASQSNSLYWIGIHIFRQPLLTLFWTVRFGVGRLASADGLQLGLVLQTWVLVCKPKLPLLPARPSAVAQLSCSRVVLWEDLVLLRLYWYCTLEKLQRNTDLFI